MIHNTARLPLPALISPGAADDLRSGKQLVGADGSVVSGALAEVQQAVPTISVSSGGLITASATQSGGIIAAGSKSAAQQLPTQAAKTVTPGTTAQTAVAPGRYTTGAVQVAGDANLKAENIAEGVSIFGVTGTHSGGGGDGAIIEVDMDTYVNNKERDAGMIGDDYAGLGFYLPPQSILESLFELEQDIPIYIGMSDSGPVMAEVDLYTKRATIEGNFLVDVYWGEDVQVNDEVAPELVLRYFLYKN